MDAGDLQLGLLLLSVIALSGIQYLCEIVCVCVCVYLCVCVSVCVCVCGIRVVYIMSYDIMHFMYPACYKIISTP